MIRIKEKNCGLNSAGVLSAPWKGGFEAKLGDGATGLLCKLRHLQMNEKEKGRKLEKNDPGELSKLKGWLKNCRILYPHCFSRKLKVGLKTVGYNLDHAFI